MTRSKLCHEAGAIKAEIAATQKRQKVLGDQLKAIHRQISALDASEVVVTDHAVVRWLERMNGLDLEGVRAQIADAARPHIGAHERVSLGNGLVMLIDGHRVVTIMPEGTR